MEFLGAVRNWCAIPSESFGGVVIQENADGSNWLLSIPVLLKEGMYNLLLSRIKPPDIPH